MGVFSNDNGIHFVPTEMSQLLSCDQAFTEIINKNMVVPEHLSIRPRQQWWGEEGEDALRCPEEPQPAYTMQVPERLTYTGRVSNAPLF